MCVKVTPVVVAKPAGQRTSRLAGIVPAGEVLLGAVVEARDPLRVMLSTSALRSPALSPLDEKRNAADVMVVDEVDERLGGRAVPCAFVIPPGCGVLL